MKRTLAHLRDWFDLHGLFVVTIFLVVFIPLYPKIPLADLIPGYLVKLRLEDLFVGAAGMIWMIQLARQKITWRSAYFWMVIAYGAVGIVSIVLALFLQQSIPWQKLHLSKTVLHYARYLEYLSVFFIAFAGIKTKTHIQVLLVVLWLTLLGVFGYGVAQLEGYAPVFSTMNREFSKGIALTLSEGTRLHSTFGGHYDLAAWLVLILPVTFLAGLFSRRWLSKVIWWGSIPMGLWLLWQTASKISLFATLVGLMLATFYFAWAKLDIFHEFIQKKKILWSMAGICFVLLGLVFLTNPGNQLLQAGTGLARQLLGKSEVAVVDPSLSENAQKYGLSLGIRLDTLWPQALLGWTINPITGKGYGTLSQAGALEFTEADSTDNNFLRILGETGSLGFIIFFGLVGVAVTQLLSARRSTIQQHPEYAIVTGGLIAATVGILINATMIDVFAASKVAFSFWLLLGAGTKAGWLYQPKVVMRWHQKLENGLAQLVSSHWPFWLAFIWLFALVHKRPFTDQSLILNLTSTHNYQSLLDGFCRVATCSADVPITINLSTPYSLLLSLVFRAIQHPSMFYILNLWLISLSLYFFYLSLKKLINQPWAVAAVLLAVVSLPTVHSLPLNPTSLNLWLVVALMLLHQATKWWQNHLPPLPPQVKFSHQTVSTVLGISSLLVLLLTGWQQQLASSVIKNFRDSYQPYRFQAVRQANDYFSRSSLDENQRYLISAINPAYYQLYGKSGYQAMQLATENFEEYRKLLKSKPTSVFLSNAEVEHHPEPSIFEKVKAEFGVTMVAYDCDLRCNIYQLSQDDLPLATYPAPSLRTTAQTQEVYTKIVFLPSRFDTNLYRRQPSISQVGQKYRMYFESENPDLVWVLGDLFLSPTPTQKQTLEQTWSTQVEYPISFIAGNFDKSVEKGASGSDLAFQQGNSLVVSYSANPDGSFDYKKRLFWYNLLLQLEQRPEISHVYLVSGSSYWILNHPTLAELHPVMTDLPLSKEHDDFIAADVIPALESMDNKNFYFVSGGVRPSRGEAFFFEQIANIQYLAAGGNHTQANDGFVVLELGETPTLTAVSTPTLKEVDLRELGSSHWWSILEEIRAENTERQ